MQIFQNTLARYRKLPTPARAGAWFVVCTLLHKGIAFITVPIFTRIMPTDAYGVYSTYLSWYSILSVICTMEMHRVIYINYYHKAETQVEKDRAAIPLLSLASVSTLGWLGIFLIFKPWLQPIIGLPTSMVILLLLQILFEPPVMFWMTKQRFTYRYMLLVIQTVVLAASNALLGILFVKLAPGQEALARVCSIVLVQVVFGTACFISFARRAKALFSTVGWKRALRVQIPLVPHDLSLNILSTSDRIMIKALVDAAAAAVYGVAYSAAIVVNWLKKAIVDAMRPWLYQQIKAQNYTAIQKTTNAVMILVVMLSVSFSAFAPEVIALMAPAQYYEAVYVIPPVAASSLFTFIYNIFSVITMYHEETTKILRASVIAAAVNLVLNWLLIPVFGFIAAAYTTLFSYMLLTLAHYCSMRYVCKKYMDSAQVYDIRFILLISLIALAIMLAFVLTYRYPFVRYGIFLVACIIGWIKRRELLTTLKQFKKD